MGHSSVLIEKRVQLNRIFHVGAFVLLFSLASHALTQTVSTRKPHRRGDATVKEAWAFSALVDGYYVPGEQGYVDPIFTADRRWVHLEARYNYEDLRTGSLWFGYNFNFGSEKTLTLTLTPMVGGVFGRTDGIAPGLEASLTYKKLNFWVGNEYVFDIRDSSGNYFYTWPQLTYSPTDWLRVGFVAQRTLAIQSDTQYGFLIGLSHKKTDFTSYILNPGPKPTVVLEVGYNF